MARLGFFSPNREWRSQDDMVLVDPIASRKQI